MRKQEIKKKVRITDISAWIVVVELLIASATLFALGFVFYNVWMFTAGIFVALVYKCLAEAIEQERASRKDN